MKPEPSSSMAWLLEGSGVKGAVALSGVGDTLLA
jgi:hypothetical protein